MKTWHRPRAFTISRPGPGFSRSSTSWPCSSRVKSAPFYTRIGLCLWCLVIVSMALAPAQGQPRPGPDRGSTPTLDFNTAMTAAQAALARGDFNYAIIQAGEALKVRPDDPTAKQILARAQKAKSDQADYDRALKVARDAIAKGDNPKAIEILT